MGARLNSISDTVLISALDMVRSNLLSPSATSSFYSFLLKCNMNKIAKTSMGRGYKSCALKMLNLLNMFLILPIGVKWQMKFVLLCQWVVMVLLILPVVFYMTITMSIGHCLICCWKRCNCGNIYECWIFYKNIAIYKTQLCFLIKISSCRSRSKCLQIWQTVTRGWLWLTLNILQELFKLYCWKWNKHARHLLVRLN